MPMKLALCFFTMALLIQAGLAESLEKGRPDKIPQFLKWGRPANNQNRRHPRNLANEGQLTLHQLDGEKTNLSALWNEKPTLFVLGSLSCPAARDNDAYLNRIASTFGERINVILLYTREAHPIDQPSPYSEDGDEVWLTERNRFEKILVDEPSTIEARIKRAKDYQKKVGCTSRILVDGLGNEVWQVLGAGPNTATLVTADGVVRDYQGWFDPPKMAGRIRAYLDRTEYDQTVKKMKKLRVSFDLESWNRESEEISEIQQKVPDILSTKFFSSGIRSVERTGETLLHLAVRESNLVLLGKLLRLGASPKSQDQFGYTSLHYALRPTSTEMAKGELSRKRAIVGLLLEAEEKPYQKTDRLLTPVHLAVNSGDLARLKLVIEAKAPLDQKSYDGIAPLHAALFQHHEELADLLVSKGAQIDLFAAAGLGDLDRVKELLNENPNAWTSSQGRSGRTPLIYAAVNGHLEVIRYLLAQENPKIAYTNAQLIACLKIANQHRQFSSCLEIAKIAEPLPEGRGPSAQYGLIQKLPPLTLTYRSTPFINEAAAAGNQDLIALLLARGWDPNQPDASNFTPLFYAACNGSTEAIRTLVKEGANLEAKSLYQIAGSPFYLRPGNQIPLQSARSSGDINHTPLHAAILRRQVEAVRVFVELKADLSHQDYYGINALHRALPSAYSDQEDIAKLKEIVRILIQAGADPDELNKSGKSFRTLLAEPIDKVKREGNRWVKDRREPRSFEILALVNQLKKK